MSAYLRAAKKRDEGKPHGACDAIEAVRGSCDDIDIFHELFKPEGEYVPLYWGDQWGDNADDCRVLALLFMHWHETMKDGK